MHYQNFRIFFVHQRPRTFSRAYRSMVLSSSSTFTRTSVTLLHWSQALIPHFISHSQTSVCNKQFNYVMTCALTSNGKALRIRDMVRWGPPAALSKEGIMYKVLRDMWEHLVKPVLDALGYNLVRYLSHSPIAQLCLIILLSLDNQVDPIFGGVPLVPSHTFRSMLPVSIVQQSAMRVLVFLTSSFHHTLRPLAPL